MSSTAPLTAPLMALSIGDWFNLFLYYLSLSLLAVGGAIATAPDMHPVSYTHLTLPTICSV